MEGQKWPYYVPSKDTCVLNEAIDTQGINSGGYSNDNRLLISALLKPMQSMMEVVLSETQLLMAFYNHLRVTLYYNLLCIRVCALYE